MKWGDLKRVLRKKLNATEESKKKHDVMVVYCGGTMIGEALISRGSDDAKGREIGNVARSLGISEHNLKELVACTLSGEDYCKLVLGK